MIIEDVCTRVSEREKRRFIDGGVIVDSWVLTVFFVDGYVKSHQDKSFIINSCDRITEEQMSCLNSVLANFRISRFVVTPHIFSEFINHVRRHFKAYGRDIFDESAGIIKNFREISITNKSIVLHVKFHEFGNDISLCIATEEQIKLKGYSCVLSFDERFIYSFFKDDKNVLAFNLNVLQYFY